MIESEHSSASTSKEPSYLTSLSSAIKDSSETTTIPQLSSSFSAIGSQETSIRTLRKQLQLMRIQLEQREKELNKCEFINTLEDACSRKWKKENEIQMRRANILEGICANLLNCLEESEVTEKEKLDAIAATYAKHVEYLAYETTTLKRHNASLQRRISDANAKIIANENEKEFLRCENDRYQKELSALKTRNETDQHDIIALRNELRLLKKSNDDLNAIHNMRLNEEIDEAISKKISENESLRRKLKDREKEYGINLSRMHNENIFMKNELKRKEQLCTRFTHMLNKLTKDNQQLFDEITVIRSTSEREVKKLNDAINCAKEEASKAYDSERILRGTIEEYEKAFGARQPSNCTADIRQRILMSSRDEQLDKANATIACLQKKVENLLSVKNISTHCALISALNEKSLRIAELESNVQQLQLELEREKEQRENSTALLIEMGRDMRSLLETIAEND